MNELIFFIQILLLVSVALGALKLGKLALVSFVSVQALVANLFVLKQIELFGMLVTASDAFAIGSLLGLNIIQEHYGRKDAQEATWICFFFMLFFALISLLHLAYIPSPLDFSQDAFMTLLSPAPRLFIASLTTFFLVQQFDIRFLELVKNKFPAASFAMRTGIALAASQLLDTILFSFLGLYGIVGSIAEIIILSFFIKMIAVACCTTLLRLTKT